MATAHHLRRNTLALAAGALARLSLATQWDRAEPDAAHADLATEFQPVGEGALQWHTEADWEELAKPAGADARETGCSLRLSETEVGRVCPRQAAAGGAPGATAPPRRFFELDSTMQLLDDDALRQVDWTPLLAPGESLADFRERVVAAGATAQGAGERNGGAAGAEAHAVPESWLLWLEMADRAGVKTLYRVDSQLPTTGGVENQRTPLKLLEVEETKPIVSAWIREDSLDGSLIYTVSGTTENQSKGYTMKMWGLIYISLEDGEVGSDDGHSHALRLSGADDKAFEYELADPRSLIYDDAHALLYVLDGSGRLSVSKLTPRADTNSSLQPVSVYDAGSVELVTPAQLDSSNFAAAEQADTLASLTNITAMALFEHYLVLSHEAQAGSIDSEGRVVPATYGDITVYDLKNLGQPTEQANKTTPMEASVLAKLVGDEEREIGDLVWIGTDNSLKLERRHIVMTPITYKNEAADSYSRLGIFKLIPTATAGAGSPPREFFMYQNLDLEELREPGRRAVLSTQLSSGTIAFQQPDYEPTVVKFCPESQYFSYRTEPVPGSEPPATFNVVDCLDCPAGEGTLWFQQTKCMKASDMATGFGANAYAADAANRRGYSPPTAPTNDRSQEVFTSVKSDETTGFPLWWVGVIVGGLVLAALIAFLIWCCCCRKKKPQKATGSWYNTHLHEKGVQLAFHDPNFKKKVDGDFTIWQSPRSKERAAKQAVEPKSAAQHQRVSQHDDTAADDDIIKRAFAASVSTDEVRLQVPRTEGKPGVHASFDPDLTGAELYATSHTQPGDDLHATSQVRGAVDWQRTRHDIRQFAHEACERRFAREANHALDDAQIADIFQELADRVSRSTGFPIAWNESAKQRTFVGGVDRHERARFTQPQAYLYAVKFAMGELQHQHKAFQPHFVEFNEADKQQFRDHFAQEGKKHARETFIAHSVPFDGFLTRQQADSALERVWTKATSLAGRDRSWSVHTKEQLFNSADLNHDNKISLNELENFYYRVMCNSVSSQVPGLDQGMQSDRIAKIRQEAKKTAWDAFQENELDRNGCLTFKQMMPYLERMYKLSAQVAQEKRIEIEPWSEKAALDKFRACDEDGSGTIDQSEFENFLYDFLHELSMAIYL